MRIPMASVAFLVGLAFMVSATPLAGQESREKLEALEEQAFKEAAALVGPSVVRIQTVGGLDRVGRMLTGTGPTTGVVLSQDGFIISSAYNFVSKPASVLVTLPDQRRFAAQVIATDRSRMLTLLKIAATKLTPARVAPKKSIQVGQWAIALGRTYNTAAPNVSLGIVSAVNRVWGKAIQTDAKISPANYGGPLVDIEGRVMGILAPLSQSRGATEVAGVEWYDSGIGFAVPLEDVYATLDRLKKGKDLKPGLIGITLTSRDLYEVRPEIDRVRYDSPAEKAGLKPGDVISEIDGKPVIRQAQLQHNIGSKLAGDKIAIAVKRGKETIRRELVLVAELQPYEPAFLGVLPARPSAIGEDVSPGVTVRHVIENSPAAKAGLKRRDRIVGFNGKSVSSSIELANLVGRVRPGANASLIYQRADQQFKTKVELVTVPNDVVKQLSPVIVGAASADQAKTGRISQAGKDGKIGYWAYIPEDYNSDHDYSLMVWIHPNNDTMETEMFRAWKSLCDQRGIIILAPKATEIAGFALTEAESVKGLVDDFCDEYSIADERIFLHAFSNGGQFATHLAFKYQEDFRGLVLCGAAIRSRPPEHRPDFRQQFFLLCGQQDNLLRLVELSVNGLRQIKFPTSFEKIEKLSHKYPPPATLDQISRWADSLDRI